MKNKDYLSIGGVIMLEIVFNDSEKAALKIAKNRFRGATDNIDKKSSKTELDKPFEDQAIGRSSQDVICIGFSFDIGDISGEIDGIERQNVFSKVWGRFNFNKKDQEQFFQNQRQDFERLLYAVNHNIPIRIWKSNTPDSICGFYFICHVLRDIDSKISTISLPESNQVSKSEIVSYSKWSEVAVEKFQQFLPLERQLSRIEKQVFSDHWCDLIAENAPLRAIISGKLISVPEHFYDQFITRNLPDGNFSMIRLIGTILTKYNLGISDSWYALRIDKMIAENKLIVIKDKDTSHPYGKILRKAKI